MEEEGTPGSTCKGRGKRESERALDLLGRSVGKLHDKKWPKMRLVAQDQITVGLESHPEDLGLQLMNRHPQHLDEFLKVNAQLNAVK